MSVRSLTKQLGKERIEARRRAAGAVASDNGRDSAVDSLPSPPSALYKGVKLEETPKEEAPQNEQSVSSGLKPREETPSEAIPGGIADRFRLRSQRLSEISKSTDAYTAQLTTAPESHEDVEDPDSDAAPITIELQSH